MTDILQKRTLGNSRFEVSVVGLDCMGLTRAYGSVPDEQAGVSLIRAAVERGVTFFDTAEVYGPFTNEELVGEALAPFKNRVAIATKFGFNIDPETGERRGANSRPEYVKQAAEGSLRRLGVDVIDIFYQHCGDPTVQIEEVAGAVKSLIQEGKVKHFGLCDADADTIRRAHAVLPVTAVRCEYSLWSRGPEADVLPTVEKLGIGFVASSPLGGGVVVGKADVEKRFDGSDLRAKIMRYVPTARKANVSLVELLRDVAKRKGATPTQISLAWVLAQKPWIVLVAGSTTIARLEDSVGAGAIALDEAELRDIAAAASKITPPDDRPPIGALRFR